MPLRGFPAAGCAADVRISLIAILPEARLARFCQPIEVGKRCDPNLHRKWLRFKKKVT
jgi:hypothetical protein